MTEASLGDRVPVALKLGCGALVLNAALNAAEVRVNPSAFPLGIVLFGAAIDALLAALVAFSKWREPVRRLVIVRLIAGLLLIGGQQWSAGNRIGATMQLLLSVSTLLLFVSDAARTRYLGATAVNAVVQLARVVIVLGALRGYALLGPWTEGARYEPHVATVRGRAYPYQWTLPARWQPMKADAVDALRIEADRLVANLVRDVQVAVIGNRIRWNQRFEPQAHIDALVNNARSGWEDFSIVQRGTLPAPLRTPFVEYRGRPRSADGLTASGASSAPELTVIATVVQDSTGGNYTLLAMRRANAPAAAREECVAAIEGFSVDHQPLRTLPDALRGPLEPIADGALRGSAVPYRMRIEPGWFAKSASAMEQGQDRSVVVPFEDAVIATSVLRVGNAIDAAGTARQAVTRLGTTGTPEFEDVALPDTMPGRMVRFRANVSGDRRVGYAAVFVRERDSVLVVASVPVAVEAQRLPEAERMLRSFVFE